MRVARIFRRNQIKAYPLSRNFLRHQQVYFMKHPTRQRVKELAETARSAASPWGMETDFLDDPRRPGAVLGPKTVPKRTQQLCSALLSADWSDDEVSDLMMSIHSEWPADLYSSR